MRATDAASRADDLSQVRKADQDAASRTQGANICAAGPALVAPRRILWHADVPPCHTIDLGDQQLGARVEAVCGRGKDTDGLAERY